MKTPSISQFPLWDVKGMMFREFSEGERLIIQMPVTTDNSSNSQPNPSNKVLSWLKACLAIRLSPEGELFLFFSRHLSVTIHQGSVILQYTFILTTSRMLPPPPRPPPPPYCFYNFIFKPHYIVHLNDC